MNFFETLNFLFYKKREKQLDVDIETASAFSSYMTNRWWSFYDKDSALFTNNVLNRLASVFDDRSEQFKPYKPKNGMIFDSFKEEWSAFLKNV